jgi:hypothetical protein
MARERCQHRHYHLQIAHTRFTRPYPEPGIGDPFYCPAGRVAPPE